MTPLPWPGTLQINAWAGPAAQNTSAVAEDLRSRLLAANTPHRSRLLAPVPVDPRNWRDPRVGWGLVLPDDARPPGPGKAGLWPSDPEPLAALLAARGGTVLRWTPEGLPATLRRYHEDGSWQDISWQAQHYGNSAGQIPRYLLIVAPPSIIPWRVQYALQFHHFTGRLDLAGVALENHVEALLSDWRQSSADPLAQLLWAVVHDATDITALLRASVTAPLAEKLLADGDYTPDFLTDDRATAAGLIAALGQSTPALVVTSSHGATHPLGDLAVMRAQLGAPVDRGHAVLDPQAVLAGWSPDGAIWYAHACCSAGADGTTSFGSYVGPDTDVGQILRWVADCGAMTAPLPCALLGAKRPLRGFIGHVEPTFDWTLRAPDSGQFMTMPLIEALYAGLFSGQPMGMALDACRRASASLTGSYAHAVQELAAGAATQGALLRMQLAAKDWDALVLLGDPAVTIAQPRPMA